MTPVSQIIWRNRHRLEAGKQCLLVAPPADDLAARLIRHGVPTDVLSLSHAAHLWHRQSGFSSTFSLDPDALHGVFQVAVFQPREKALLTLLLDFVACGLCNQDVVWLAGENRAGIRSAASQLDSFFDDTRKLDSARHCALYVARIPVAEGSFSAEKYLGSWSFECRGASVEVRDLPGVFAQGRLDPGSRLLLESLLSGAPDMVTGRVLDFACGAGVIGCGLAIACPGIELTMLDDALLALESTKRSLAANGLEARVVASDGLSTLKPGAQAPFDWIVSNPPFHAGVRQELGIARQFIRDCPALLAPGGSLCLVANAHLPYGRWLSELFRSVQVLAADRGYNVWLAARPDPSMQYKIARE